MKTGGGMLTEQRDHPRHEILAQVRVAGERSTHVMDVANISRSGVFIATPDVLTTPWIKVGEEVELDIFSTDDLENVQLKGLIIRISCQNEPGEPGFGVTFTTASPEERSNLLRLIALTERRSIHPPPLPFGSSPGADPE